MNKFNHIALRIIDRSDELASQGDDALANSIAELRWQAQSGIVLSELTIEAFAILREAARRIHNQSHYRVQIIAGLAAMKGGVIEMQTGEGKSLTALLPAFLYALQGKGCHVVTANDYLAGRDAEFARPIFNLLGMTVGCVSERVKQPIRKVNYDCDVTFGCAKEFGFDFLRDRLAVASGDKSTIVQRDLFFAIVDEADSVMIDDARTPLLIATAIPREQEIIDPAIACTRICDLLQHEVHYEVDSTRRSCRLTIAGCLNVVRLSKLYGIANMALDSVYRQVENSLTAERFFLRDRQYVITDSGLQIVDESTGRVAEGRKWQNGLHQAIEAKERIKVTEETCSTARITYQSFFRRYKHLSGITGTATNSRREFRRIYDLKVKVISTRLPCQRIRLKPRLFATQVAKHRAIINEVRQRVDAGQAILIGTPTVEASQSLSAAFDEQCIAHEVLNCRSHAREAAIISRAGQSGQITIATNMAGRGTDIKVDDDVLRAGGLHVIATEMHSSSRIDRQLAGRTARQGEPGSFQFFLSLEDQLLQSSLKSNATDRKTSQLNLRLFQKQQFSNERLHEKQRRDLLKQEKHRAEQCRSIGMDPLLEFLE